MNALRQMLEYGRRRLHQSAREFAKFGTIGIINTVVDVGLWNLFNAIFPGAEVKTKVLASLIATSGAYIMNRQWAFRHRKRQQLHRETVLFFFFNGVGLAIQAGAVALAKYGFGTTDPFTLNVVNIFSLCVATIFRFWSYRRWVWRVTETPTEAETGTTPAAASELTPSR
ncbi:MAG: GtrA family protein [Terriglobales bacterium]